MSPRIWKVAVPRPQHSEMLGQRASSQMVFRPWPWMSLRTSKYCESALGARTFIHSGRRGLSATGSELCMNRMLLEGQAKDFLESRDGVRPHLFDGQGPPKLPRHRCE